MAKKNPGDLLTGDWNPVIGCERYSVGCKHCWYLDGIFPWQQRLGNIPADVKPNEAHVFDKRMNVPALKLKNGVVGIVQHGDLFWDKVADSTIHQVFDIMEEAWKLKKDKPKYILWTKRAERASSFIRSRYPHGLPEYIALSVSVENQTLATERLPHLLSTPTKHRIIMIEPMMGPIDLTGFEDVEWIVVGSETGDLKKMTPYPIQLDWVREVRDFAVKNNINFFIKQLGNSHKKQERELDGRTWDMFPAGFEK